MISIHRRYSTSSNYRYGFNGQEHVNELNSSSYDFGARMYDSRIGRFFSIDKYAKQFPNISPYLFAYNNPIFFVDVNGEFGDDARGRFYTIMGSAAINVITNLNANVNSYKALYMLAQYRLENGFDLNPPGNNPFNVKGQGDAGQIILTTTEYINGKKATLQQSFANFTSLQAGINGYVSLLSTNFPNAKLALMDNSKTITDFANGLMNGKLGVYATDPNYATNLKNMLKGVINDYQKDLNNQIQENNRLIASNNEFIGRRETTAEDKREAKKSNEALKKLNKKLNAEIKNLENFKKSEGLSD